MGRRRSSGRGAGRPHGGTDPAVVREWAKSQGIAVNERGRISAELMGKYQAAHA